MEFAPGGDLQSLLDANVVPFESDVAAFTRQLLEGLVYLHQRRIAHLDIKPQNLVMMGDFPACDVKLCDLEISRVLPEGAEVRELLGTPDYVAPEILQYEPITMAADMWSLGVTVYVLLTGFSPFGGETDQETFCNISRAQVDFPDDLFEDVSEPAQDFVRRLLVRDPRSRPTAKECLRHPWLQSRTSAAPVRSGCASCSAAATATATATASGPSGNQRNLRKYLSKSREALFERVVQRQQLQQQEDDQRRAERPPTRLCESHASLVSRSRPHHGPHALSPSFSRSREKLYGLRSLSRSHEVLAMVRTLSAMQLAVPSPDPATAVAAEKDAVEEANDVPSTLDNGQIWSTNVGGASAGDNQSDDGESRAESRTESRENGLGLGAIPEEAGSEPTSLSMPASASDTAEENGNGQENQEEQDEEEEEPRYSVAQLISAYNLHQEVATSSPKVTSGKFPSGPNALRLLIPDVAVLPKSDSSTLN